uniref:AlNc14C1G40 protein n=1 Tax=Albugo laibachii Nc14 TaxID=890382 RepID=F0VYN8_9STRA|nr:AlNc14C1G40 [Albugo laibachii Nc14]|eukprot:CCA13902.1 AlNc14C1G40 [Albugo laibachii Nc14]
MRLFDCIHRIAPHQQLESPSLCAMQTPPLKAKHSRKLFFRRHWHQHRIHTADFSQSDISRTAKLTLCQWFASHPRLVLFLLAVLCLWTTKLAITVQLAGYFLHVYEIPQAIQQASSEHEMTAVTLINISKCISAQARSLEDEMLDQILIDASKAIETLQRNQPKLIAAEGKVSQCLRSLVAIAIPKETQNTSACSSQLANMLFQAVESDAEESIHLEKLILNTKLSRMTQFVASQKTSLESLTHLNTLPIASRISEGMTEVVETIAADVKSLEALITQWMLKYGNSTNASARRLEVLHLPSDPVPIKPIHSNMILDSNPLQRPLKQLWNTTWRIISSPARDILKDSITTMQGIQSTLLEDVRVIDRGVKISKMKLLNEMQRLSNEWNQIVNKWTSGWEEIIHQLKSLNSTLPGGKHRQGEGGTMRKHTLVKRYAHEKPPGKDGLDTLKSNNDEENWFSSTSNYMRRVRLHLLKSKGDPNSQMDRVYSYLKMFDTLGNIYLIIAVGVKLYCGLYTPMTTLDVRDMSNFQVQSDLSQTLLRRHKLARYCYKLIVYVPMYLKAVIKRAGYLLILVLITMLLWSWKMSLYEGCIKSPEARRWADFLEDDWTSSLFGTIKSVSKQLEVAKESIPNFYLRTCRNLQHNELEPFSKNQNARREAILAQNKKCLQLKDTYATCVDILKTSNTTLTTCEPILVQLGILDQNWCQPPKQLYQNFSSCSMNITIPDLERQYACTMERVMYLTIASYWFTFTVMLTARFAAHSLLRIVGLCWWKELNNGRIQCLAFCTQDGSVDNSIFIMKRVRGHLKRVFFEIRLRVLLLLFSILIACYNTFLIFSRL